MRFLRGRVGARKEVFPWRLRMAGGSFCQVHALARPWRFAGFAFGAKPFQRRFHFFDEKFYGFFFLKDLTDFWHGGIIEA